jgi:hypothetical protein
LGRFCVEVSMVVNEGKPDAVEAGASATESAVV